VVSSFSLIWSGLCYAPPPGFGSKGQEDKTMTFLSALDEEHIREDKVVG
jgi:hypothetical protein